jgi:hypothetical protein
VRLPESCQARAIGPRDSAGILKNFVANPSRMNGLSVPFTEAIGDDLGDL